MCAEKLKQHLISAEVSQTGEMRFIIFCPRDSGVHDAQYFSKPEAEKFLGDLLTAVRSAKPD